MSELVKTMINNDDDDEDEDEEQEQEIPLVNVKVKFLVKLLNFADIIPNMVQ